MVSENGVSMLVVE